MCLSFEVLALELKKKITLALEAPRLLDFTCFPYLHLLHLEVVVQVLQEWLLALHPPFAC
jgi:hypothetical protein